MYYNTATRFAIHNFVLLYGKGILRFMLYDKGIGEPLFDHLEEKFVKVRFFERDHTEFNK